MSRFRDEEEEEDELQLILEGRDVEEYRDYEREDQTSDRESNEDKSSDEEYGDRDRDRKRSKNESKQRLNDKTTERKDRTKRKVDNDLDLASNERNSEEYKSGVTYEDNDMKVKVKVRRIVAKPRIQLNADKLMSSSGIASLPQLFSDIQFGGKGSELKDLNQIMFRLSHWSHRLFPSLTFDDFIEKCEQLGNKRAIKTFVSKIRSDMPLNLDPKLDLIEDEDNPVVDTNRDFDAIIANSSANMSANKETEDMNDMNLIEDEDNPVIDTNRDFDAIVANSSVNMSANKETEDMNGMNDIEFDFDSDLQIDNSVTKYADRLDINNDSKLKTQDVEQEVNYEDDVQEVVSEQNEPEVDSMDYIKDKNSEKSDLNSAKADSDSGEVQEGSEEVLVPSIDTKEVNADIDNEDMSEDQILREINEND